MRRRDGTQMPPLASQVVDEAGAAAVDAWIRSLGGCP
jgi:mono/diheme cytochrome c family protein